MSKIESQNLVLKKYGLRQHDIMRMKESVRALELNDDRRRFRNNLLGIEGKCGNRYFEQIFQLFPKELRTEKRRTFQAYDAVNNLLNLSYKLLYWKCYRALVKAHLETHLGFLHTLLHGRPSLACDFIELYRYLIDDFLIGYSQKLKPRDFKAKTEMFNDKKGKRMFLEKEKSKELVSALHKFFKREVNVPRVKRGSKQEIESLINEEAMLLASYLRDERKDWTPRISELS